MLGLRLLACAKALPVSVGGGFAEGPVEVPLVRGFGDPRPRVELRLRETDPPVLAVLDLGGRSARIGELLAIRRGLRRASGGARVELGTVRIGEVVVHHVVADVVPGDELVVGAGSLGGLGIAVMPSRGTVRLAADPERLLDDVGPAVGVDRTAATRWWERGVRRRGAVHDALPARVDLRPVLLRLRTDLARTTLIEGRRERVRGGSPWVHAAIAVPGTAIAAAGWWPVDEGTADPRPGVAGELGADVLAGYDLAWDFAGGRIAVRPVHHPRWADAAEVRRAAVEAEAERWPRPSVPHDDLLGRVRWGELAALRFATGDAAGAAEADEALALVAGDRCEVWLDIALRRLRTGVGDPRAALDRAVALVEGWARLPPAERDRIRAGRGEGMAQPVRCERALGLRALLGGPPTPFDDLDPGRALATGRIGAMRAALPAGGRADIGLRNALAAAQRDRGQLEPAVAWAIEVARADDPHPLTTALVLGPALVAPALEAEPDWLAGQLLLGAAPGGRVDARIAALAEARWVARPGDPAARCARILADLLAASDGPGRPALPALPEADCLAAEVLAARARGTGPGPAWDALRARWPDLVR